MYNLNRWAAAERDGAIERKSSRWIGNYENCIHYFLYASTIWKKFHKNFPPIICAVIFSSSSAAEKIHPFSLVKKFSYFASLKNGEVAVIRKFARNSIILAGVRRWHRCGSVLAVGFILLYWFKFIFLLVAVFSIIFMYFFCNFAFFLHLRTFYSSSPLNIFNGRLIFENANSWKGLPRT